MNDEDSKYVLVRVAQSQFEAHQLEAILKVAGIPCQVLSYHDTAMDGIYQMQKGWGGVRVPENRREEAEKILAAEQAATLDITEEEVEKQALVDGPGPDKRVAKSRPTIWKTTGLLVLLCLLLVFIYLCAVAIEQGGFPELTFFEWLVIVVMLVYGLVLLQIVGITSMPDKESRE
jgi:hypothetical protein